MGLKPLQGAKENSQDTMRTQHSATQKRPSPKPDCWHSDLGLPSLQFMVFCYSDLNGLRQVSMAVDK